MPSQRFGVNAAWFRFALLNNCVLGLRLCAPSETIARIAKVWKRFPLPTQATCATPLGRGGG
jgi:hypothetical protein